MSEFWLGFLYGAAITASAAAAFFAYAVYKGESLIEQIKRQRKEGKS